VKNNIVLLCICILGFSIILIRYGVKRITASTQSCSIQQLLLDQSDYPPDTIFDNINSPVDESPKESASRSSYYHESWIRELVIKYRSIDRAYEIFVSHQDSVFSPNEVYYGWEVPSILEADDISANQYEIGCGNVKNFGNRCILLAQYEEYVILFSVDISRNGVTRELFRDLVKKVDDRMTSCLSQ
jgi:hypothetical protein